MEAVHTPLSDIRESRIVQSLTHINHVFMYLIGELCAERDALGDGAQVVEDGDASAVNEIGVAEGEGGRVQVRLVVARELHRLPLALLDL